MEREIIHRCGHARRHHVGGYFVADQDREAARLARKRCAACIAAVAAEPGQVPAAPALPPLVGSPRQVAWAERIRRDRLALLDRLDPRVAAGVAAVVEARWWIDHRADDPRTAAA